VFFRFGPVTVHEASETTVAELRETVFRYVDAGFTECCLDLTGLDPAEAAAVVAEGAAPLRERELSLEVTTRDTDPDALAELVGSLGAQGIRVDVLTLPGPALRGVDDLSRHVEAAGRAVLGLADPEGAGQGSPGVRRVLSSARFCRLAAGALTQEMREAVRARALEGIPVPVALAISLDDPRTTLGSEARVKLEAFAYHETVELLGEWDVRGTGAGSVAFLSERSGY